MGRSKGLEDRKRERGGETEEEECGSSFSSSKTAVHHSITVLLFLSVGNV